MTRDTLNQLSVHESKANLYNALSRLKLLSEENCIGNLHKVDQLMSFVALLLKWNQTYNLTAIKDFSAVVDRHIIDSLAVIPNLNSYFKKKNIKTPKILDVGSGAGLPGVVLAIMMPNFKVCCLDAVGKKTAFVSAVKSHLCLKNLTTEHARVEHLKTAQADVVISRAFASISDFVRLAQTHTSENGRMVAMKAKSVEDETIELARRFPDWKVKKIEQLNELDNDMSRCLVWLQQEK